MFLLAEALLFVASVYQVEHVVEKAAACGAHASAVFGGQVGV